MRVVFLKNVDKLGLIGDEKEVKDGFARNWLIAKQMAVCACDPHAQKIIKQARQERKKISKEEGELKDLSKRLSEKTIEIKAKAGESGKLFGSVTAEDIAKELKLDKKKIEMEPIREIGTHMVTIKLGYGISAKTKILVVPVKEKKSIQKK